MKYGIIIVVFFLFSCNNGTVYNSFKENAIFISNFYLNHMKDSEKKWEVFCKTSIIDERDNILKCNEPKITIYKKEKISAVISGKNGIVDMVRKTSMIKSEVRVYSFIENTKLYSNDLYFDSDKHKIWSENGVTVVKNNIKTVAKGFIAKPDLSNIKFISHETKKI